MKVMVLAAGTGSRFRPQTLHRPKPALPFLNVPLAAYALEHTLAINPTGYVVNTFYLPEQVTGLFKELLKKFPGSHQFSHERDFIRGSGGGLKFAESFFAGEEDLLVINADEVFLPDNSKFLEEALVFHRSTGALSTIVTTHHPDLGHKIPGVWSDKKHQVLGFGRDSIAGSAQVEHYVGFQFLSSRIFKYLHCESDFNIFYDGMVSAIKSGEKVLAFPTQGVWFETGRLTDFLEATHQTLQILNGALSGNENIKVYLVNFLKKWAPHSSLILNEAKAMVWADSSAIYKPEQVIDFGVLGPRSQVIPDVLVNSSVVAANMKVKKDLDHDFMVEDF